MGMARQINPDNPTAEDIQYIKDRPWLKTELEMQGYDVPDELNQPADGAVDPFVATAQKDGVPSEQPTQQNPATTPSSASAPVQPIDDEYANMKVAELEEEIDRRNSEYEDPEDYIQKGDGKKATLQAALRQDDVDNAESPEDESPDPDAGS